MAKTREQALQEQIAAMGQQCGAFIGQVAILSADLEAAKERIEVLEGQKSASAAPKDKKPAIEAVN